MVQTVEFGEIVHSIESVFMKEDSNSIKINRYSRYYDIGLDHELDMVVSIFQGIYQGSDLPFNFTTKGVIGSNFNHCFIMTTIILLYLFQIKNSLNNSTYYPSSWGRHRLNLQFRNFFTHTLELEKKWNKMQIQMELGLGKTVILWIWVSFL